MRELPHGTGQVLAYIEMCQAWSSSQRGNGWFLLTDSWTEVSDGRFGFQISTGTDRGYEGNPVTVDEGTCFNRVIASAVKLEVWTRDKGSVFLAGARQTFILTMSCRIQKGELPS
jgi:hypothetical protein